MDAIALIFFAYILIRLINILDGSFAKPHHSLLDKSAVYKEAHILKSTGKKLPVLYYNRMALIASMSAEERF